MQGKGKSTKKSSRSAGRGNLDKNSWVAPMRDLAVRFGHTFRFGNSVGATNEPVQVKDLLGLIAVATAATTLSSAICAIKIKKITIRSPATGAANAFATVQWNGLQYEAPQYNNEVALGSAEPTVLVSKPPRGSDPAFWISQATGLTTVVCFITAPINSIIDLDATVVLQNASVLGNIAPAGYTGSSGLSAGYIMFGALDRSASSRFIPTQVSYYA